MMYFYDYDYNYDCDFIYDYDYDTYYGYNVLLFHEYTSSYKLFL